MVYAAALNSVVIPPKLSCEFAVVYDSDYDMVLYSKKGEQKIHPASTTKIATMLYSLSLNRDPNEFFQVPSHVLKFLPKEKKIALHYAVEPYLLEPDAVTIGLLPNGIYSLNDLYHGMMLGSANDAANAIAYYLGNNSIEEFMIGLNQFLQKIGCRETNFVNPGGLEYPTHRTTALDLAKMLSYGINSSEFLEIMRKETFVFESGAIADRNFSTGNQLLRPDKGLYYKHCIAGKTGYTENAGRCFVGAAKNEERTVVVSVMRSDSRNNRFIDAINLFNAAFDEKKAIRTFYNGSDPCFSLQPTNCSERLQLQLEEDLTVETFESRLALLEPRVILDSVEVPIQKGEVCGRVEIIAPSGKVIASKSLIAAKGVSHSFQTLAFMYKYQIMLVLLAIFSLAVFLKKNG
ncbi:MAG: D-alanyl-D-alanine carboxypeptidase family protein [Chlamydiia bacterium]